jgi:hypothetical protein
MEVLKFLPFPIELIRYIISYDRALSVEKISKNDNRYNVLTSIPIKIPTDLAMDGIGYQINFSNPYHKLFAIYIKKQVLFSFVNTWQDESDCHIYE